MLYAHRNYRGLIVEIGKDLDLIRIVHEPKYDLHWNNVRKCWFLDAYDHRCFGDEEMVWFYPV